jgi:hypothetical protein
VFWLTQLQPKRRADASKTLVKISYFYSLSGLKKQILDKKIKKRVAILNFSIAKNALVSNKCA